MSYHTVDGPGSPPQWVRRRFEEVRAFGGSPARRNRPDQTPLDHAIAAIENLEAAWRHEAEVAQLDDQSVVNLLVEATMNVWRPAVPALSEEDFEAIEELNMEEVAMLMVGASSTTIDDACFICYEDLLELPANTRFKRMACCGKICCKPCALTELTQVLKGKH